MLKKAINNALLKFEFFRSLILTLNDFLIQEKKINIKEFF